MQSGELIVTKPCKVTLDNAEKRRWVNFIHLTHFGDEILPFAVFMKHFTWSLASCRDRPLQITNNIRVQLAYQITDVTWPQTHRVVCLWAHHVHADALRADARWIPACSERTSRWKRRGSAGWIETSKLDSRGVVSNAQVWKSCLSLHSYSAST